MICVKWFIKDYPGMCKRIIHNEYLKLFYNICLPFKNTAGVPHNEITEKNKCRDHSRSNIFHYKITIPQKLRKYGI